ncbi:uncharacterized protein [Periplaneta americana]|uniref:uncharacterized protein n=1 Tax=Periplaneta americana TaxID=6978 RepID=UPI0037E94D91
MEKSEENQFMKRRGTADGAGERFEVMVIALLFVRGHNRCHSFRIASNMEDCGTFDDVIFQYKLQDSWYTSFLQLKHKKSPSLPLKSFHITGNDFDLFKYLQSYHTILQRFSPTTNHLVFAANLDHCSFFLYTNAVFNTKRQLKHGTFLYDDIHNSGGSDGFVFGFSEDNKEDKFVIALFKDLQHCQQSIRNIYERIGDKQVLDDSLLLEIEELVKTVKISEIKDLIKSFRNKPTKINLKTFLQETDYISSIDIFLKNIQVIDGQAGVEELNDVIKQEIYEACGTDQHETNEIFNELIKHTETWWRRGTEYLTEDSQFWGDIMKSRGNRVAQLSAQKLQQLDRLSIRFRYPEQIPLNASVINVVAERGCSLLSCVKVRQLLDATGETKYLFIDLPLLEHKEKEVLSLWPTRWCDILVVDCGDNERGSAVVLYNKLRHKSKLVLVTSDVVQDIENVHLDVCDFEQLDEKTQKRLFEESVTFQGHVVQFGMLTEGNDEVIKAVNGKLILELLCRSECPEFGKLLNSLEFFYIERRVIPHGYADKSASIPKNLWEIHKRIFLLTAEPGMGKSAFMTHMALETKETDPSSWIISVNLNEHSADLDKLSESNCSVEQAVEFLWKVASIHCGCNFELLLFRHAVQTSGKSVVLLDAFDEISPAYTEKTLQLIKAISKTRVGKLCVAFRPVVREMLESVLRVKSYTLSPLSRQERTEVLYALWKHCANLLQIQSLMLNIPEKEIKEIRSIYGIRFENDDPDENIKQLVLNMLTEGANAFSTDFWSIPLHISLLATVYESHVIVSMNDGSMYVPGKFDIIKLYTDFVEKKLKIYCHEKKDEIQELSAVLDDNEILREQFMENHAVAGVLALLPPDLIRELHDKRLESKFEKFLKRIEMGKEKRGVIMLVIAGKPYIVHQTFAEYFAAIWFSSNYHENISVLQAIYFVKNYEVFREMFDRILAQNNPLHQHILDHNPEEILAVVSENITTVDSGGRTALHIAVLYQNFSFGCVAPLSHCTLIDILLHYGALVTPVDNIFGLTPIQYADRMGNDLALGELFRVLDFDPTSMDLLTLCQHAACYCDVTLRKSTDARMGLLVAAQFGILDIALLLMKAGVDVNCRDTYGKTPLHLAAQNGHYELVQILIEKGHADISVSDRFGVNVIDVATKRVKNLNKNMVPHSRKCVMYYSEMDNILLPYRNWRLFQSYYTPEYTRLRFHRMASSRCYLSIYRHLFVPSLERKYASWILRYLETIATK